MPVGIRFSIKPSRNEDKDVENFPCSAKLVLMTVLVLLLVSYVNTSLVHRLLGLSPAYHIERSEIELNRT